MNIEDAVAESIHRLRLVREHKPGQPEYVEKIEFLDGPNKGLTITITLKDE